MVLICVNFMRPGSTTQSRHHPVSHSPSIARLAAAWATLSVTVAMCRGTRKKAQGILSEHREQLNIQALALLQKEILEADEIQELIDRGSEQSRTVAGAGQ